MMRYVKALRSLSKLILHPLIHTLLKFALALGVGISQDGCVGKRKPLDTLSRIEGLMKSPLTDTYHRYGWSQAYGDLGLNSPFFIVRIIGDIAQLCQYEEPPFLRLTGWLKGESADCELHPLIHTFGSKDPSTECGTCP